MTLAIDGSSPAPLDTGWLGGLTTTVVTSNSFSPPAGSVIVCMVSADESYTGVWDAPIFSDSLGGHLTWHTFATQADSTFSFGGVWIGWANCPSSQTGMTATCTLTPNGGGQYTAEALIDVAVYTGAASTPLVNAVTGTGSGATQAVTVTPFNTGSHVRLLSCRMATGATADTAGANTYISDSYAAVNAARTTAWYGTSTIATATAGVAVTLNLATSDASPLWQYIAYEVAPASAGAPVTGWDIGNIQW